VLVLGERLQAIEKDLREACALHDRQLQRFGFQVGLAGDAASGAGWPSGPSAGGARCVMGIRLESAAPG